MTCVNHVLETIIRPDLNRYRLKIAVFYDNRLIMKDFGSGEEGVTRVLTSKVHPYIFIYNMSGVVN
jgi:hypothetical protein